MNLGGPRIVQVIHCSLERRGSGKTPSDCVRRVYQLYALDGELICEYDIGPDEDGQAFTSFTLPTIEKL